MSNTYHESGRDILRDLLSTCTEEQRTLFNRMYGNVDTIDPSKIDWAIQQCELTIEHNSKKK